MTSPSSGDQPTGLDRANPVVLVLIAVLSVQFGGALAATLLPLVGVAGSVTLRMVIAAAVLMAIVRPKLSGRSRREWTVVALFAASMTLMNLAFYASLVRLPIGVAVTIEFLGPLLLAASLSRRGRDVASVVAALIGVALISEVLTTSWSELDVLGIGLAAAAGACWAAYILLAGRTGASFRGLDGIAIAMTISAIVMLPLGIADAGSSLWSGEVLLRGIGIALLSSAIPYSLELVALRRIAAGAFGVLLSLEPAAAALAGLVVLGQQLTLVQLAGMALVVAASSVVLGAQGRRPRPPAG